MTGEPNGFFSSCILLSRWLDILCIPGSPSPPLRALSFAPPAFPPPASIAPDSKLFQNKSPYPGVTRIRKPGPPCQSEYTPLCLASHETFLLSASLRAPDCCVSVRTRCRRESIHHFVSTAGCHPARFAIQPPDRVDRQQRIDPAGPDPGCQAGPIAGRDRQHRFLRIHHATERRQGHHCRHPAERYTAKSPHPPRHGFRPGEHPDDQFHQRSSSRLYQVRLQQRRVPRKVGGTKQLPPFPLWLRTVERPRLARPRIAGTQAIPGRSRKQPARSQGDR